MSSSPDSRPVYSTETGSLCPECGRARANCACAAAARGQILGDGKVVVARQTKGRGGKTVTVVKGVALDTAGLAALGKQLRSRCGAGGTVKDGVIEIQGEHGDTVLQALLQAGYTAKLLR